MKPKTPHFSHTLTTVALTTLTIGASSLIFRQLAPTPANAQQVTQEAKPDMTQSQRQEKGRQVIAEASKQAGQPALDKLEKDFPFLADSTLEYALGEVWARQVLDPKTRQLVAVSAMAAQGTLPQMKIHAGYALNYGVTRDELREVIYMMTVTSGFPRALNAANALQEVFDEHDKNQEKKMNTTNQVWFITGASKGLGLALAQELLQNGQRVAATSRDAEALKNVVGAHDDFLALEVDLNDENSVSKSIEQTIARFGRVDVIVNNAGYGQLGTLEELSDAEARTNFDVNVFGALNVVRAAMPHLRAQKSGQIFNISSVGGYTGSFAGWGIYCATKFALSGLSEALAAEAAPFGIHVTIVYPGYFRTEFLDSGSLGKPTHPIEAYQNARESEAYHESIKGEQPGDPRKAAQVMIDVAAADAPPVHLFLGADAYDMAAQKMEQVQADLDAWKELATATDVD